MNIFKKTLSNLINTKDKIRETFSNISFNKKLSNDDFESIEECLLEADVSWSLVEKIIDYIKNNDELVALGYVQNNFFKPKKVFL